MIGRELKRILQKPAALVCIIVYIGIMILGVETDLRADHESGILSLFYRKLWCDRFYTDVNFSNSSSG